MTTPLHEAVKGGNLHIVADLLEQGSAPHATDSMGRTPIWYVFDCAASGREPIHTSYYLFLALVKHGADAKDDALRECLSIAIDGFHEVDDGSLWGIRIQMGLPVPDVQDEDDLAEEPFVRRTADDTPVRWCDWARTDVGFRRWVIAHPDVQATGVTLDDALDALVEATMKKLEDYEPNIHFAHPLPEDVS